MNHTVHPSVCRQIDGQLRIAQLISFKSILRITVAIANDFLQIEFVYLTIHFIRRKEINSIVKMSTIEIQFEMPLR